ncbi:hypothetical protein [Corynebacterium freneyi]|uniref:Uncharacterized protein n=1 Tax=Corynebacterium freneyi DNF00450 TaxID=1287475 RepID=A0A095ZFG7_9CORY|nr:hypothetical protein [Corynebacterium freneyi]KGF17382.1 hypothetical protein HMPREF1650_04265 [Corynebacterium freneyi DNF00450]
MTDQTIPAAAIRAWREKYEGCTGNTALEALDALLPPPPRPTLADMTSNERIATRWTQADVQGQRGRAVIIAPLWDSRTARVMWDDGETTEEAVNAVTPRPDLPPLEWPGDQKPEEVTPVKVGDVIESADDPRLAALPAGSILVDRDGGAFEVTKADTGEWGGIGYVPSQGTGTKWGPWTVRRIGKEADQ